MVQALKAKYTGGGPLHCASAKSNFSWVWHGIWKVRDLLAKWVCCLPKCGASVRIWQDLWIPLLPSFCPKPLVADSIGEEDVAWNHTVHSLFDFEANSWNMELLVSLFDPTSVVAISSLPPLNLFGRDRWLWLRESKNYFSVASAYRLTKPWTMYDHHPVQGREWKKVWSLRIQDCLKLFLWKFLQAALPIQGLLAPFLSSTSSVGFLCPLCGLAMETTEHLFMRCQLARFAWHESSWPLHMKLVIEILFAVFVKQLIMTHRFFGIGKASLQHFMLCPYIVLDSIWHLRNEVVHKLARPDLLVLIASIRRRFGEHLVAWAKVSPSACLVWLPPPLGGVNVAVRSSHLVLAVVLRDHEGSPCTVYTERRPHQNLFLGETAALFAVIQIFSFQPVS